MKLIFSFVVWITMATIMTKGVIAAVHGSYWLLILSVLCFVALVGKIGCLSHD